MTMMYLHQNKTINYCFEEWEPGQPKEFRKRLHYPEKQHSTLAPSFEDGLQLS